MNPTLAVIGGGVIGLCTARALALQGARVTLLEANLLGAGTSQTTFAWVNSNGKAPAAYHALNVAGMRAHQALQRQHSGQPRWLDECGTYEWATDPAEAARLNARAHSLQGQGYAAELADREALARVAPDLRLPAEAVAIWRFAEEALVYPARFVAFLRQELQRLGVVVREHTAVMGIEETPQGIHLQLAGGEHWAGDYAVSAVGRWSAPLLAGMGIELAMIDADRPGSVGCSFLGYTGPLATALPINLIAPELNLRPDGEGGLILQALDLDDLADPAAPPAADGEIARELLARLAKRVRNSEGARLQRIAVGQRARPADGLPALGFVSAQRRLYLAATHSGITLAPALGELIAEELLHGTRPALLADYSPQRLLGKTAADFATIEKIRNPSAQ